MCSAVDSGASVPNRMLMVEEARTRPVHTSEYSEWRRASTKELKAGGSRSRLPRRAVGGRERGCWQAACGLQTVSRQARRPLPTDRGGRLLRIFSDASCGGLHCAWQALWSEDLGEHRGPAWKDCGPGPAVAWYCIQALQTTNRTTRRGSRKKTTLQRQLFLLLMMTMMMVVSMMPRLQLPQMMTRVVVSDDDRIVAVSRCILLCLV